VLGLPSTTEVMRPMPKVAFYEHLKLKPQEKKNFVSQIDKITLANSIKPSTMNIQDGEKHHEILVLRLDLKHKEIDGALLEAIARQNHHPLIFACHYLNEMRVNVFRQRLYGTEWQPSDYIILNTDSKTIDGLWDSVCSQVALGNEADMSSDDLEAQLSLKHQIEALESEVKRLTGKSRKERQLALKNKLYEEARIMRIELDNLYKKCPENWMEAS
jgi:hypothetical protein